MTKHEGLPVAGYQPQSDDNVATVNENKVLEERILRQIDRLMLRIGAKGPGVLTVDGRWLSISRTLIEQGFMALNRAVFQPSRIDLPDDQADDIAGLKASNERMADILSGLRERLGIDDNESILATLDNLPYFASPPTRVPGEAYGRGPLLTG